MFEHRAAFRLTLHRSGGLARLAAASACAAALGLPAAAGAASVSGSSEATGFQGTLDGTRLTLTAGEAASGAFLDSVHGRLVTVACASGFGDLIESDLGADTVTPPFDVAALGGGALWPDGATSLSFELLRDVSESVDGCVVTGPRPSLAAAFGFSDVGRLLLTELDSGQRLALAHSAAKSVARVRPDRRFPGARRLAAGIGASERQLDVRLARDAERAAREGVVYVLRRGTNHKLVRLAYRGPDGLTVVEGRRRGELTSDDADFDPTEIISGERGLFARAR